MITFKNQIEIQAPASAVWKIMIDVENWHEWTSTILAVKKLNGRGFDIGTKLLIEQPELPAAVWQIFEIAEERSFSMKKGNLFLQVIAGHQLEPIEAWTLVTLSLDFSGLFAKPVAKKYQPMMERYLQTEIAGLKKACENLPQEYLIKEI